MPTTLVDTLYGIKQDIAVRVRHVYMPLHMRTGVFLLIVKNHALK